MNADVKKLWVEALRSGAYKQGTKALHPDADTFCCLGVLCDLHIRATGGLWRQQCQGLFDYQGYGSTLPDTVTHWADLNEDNPAVGTRSLAELNDDGMTFADIADIIDAW